MSALAVSLYVRQEVPQAVDGAMEVHAQQPIPHVIPGGRYLAATDEDRRVVDQQMNLAKLSGDPIGGRTDGLLIRHIGLDADRTHAASGDFLRGRRQGLLTNVE
jgi:hypothetical protein